MYIYIYVYIYYIYIYNIFVGAIPQARHLWKGREKAKKATKRQRHRKKSMQSKKNEIPHINSSMYFFCNSVVPSWFLLMKL